MSGQVTFKFNRMHNSTQGITGNLVVVDETNNPIRIDSKLFNNGKLEDSTLLSILTETTDNRSVLFKFSQYINTWMRKEFEIGKEFLEMASYLPHFMYSICFIDELPVHIFKNTNVLYNPFVRPHPDIFNVTNTMREIAMFKYIDGAETFGQYMTLTENMFKVNEIYKQIAIAMHIAQKQIGFCHNDLHADNVLVAKCDPDIMLLYILPNNTNILVETFGKLAVIIDFGFSYTNKLDNLNVMTDTIFAYEGLLPVYQDFKTDTRTFMIRMTHEIFFQRERNEKLNKKLTDFVKSSASRQIPLDAETGLFKIEKKTFVHDLQEEFTNHLKNENVCDLFSHFLCFYSFVTSMFQLTTLKDLRNPNCHPFDKKYLTDLIVNFNNCWSIVEKNFSRFSRKRSIDTSMKSTALAICDKYLVSDNTCYAFQCAVETFLRVLLSATPTEEQPNEFANSFSKSMHEKFPNCDLEDMSGTELFGLINEMSKLCDEKLMELTKSVIEKNKKVNDDFQKHMKELDLEKPESILNLLLKFADPEKLISFVADKSTVVVIDTVKKVHKFIKIERNSTMRLNGFRARKDQLNYLIQIYNRMV